MNHGAGAAGFPSRNRAALALIFGMHILVLFAWMRQRPVRLPEAPHVVTFLLRPAPPRQPQAFEPARAAAPSARPALPPTYDIFGGPPGPVATRAPAPPAEAPPAAQPTAPASPSATVPGLDEAVAPTTVQDAIREQQQAEGGFGVGVSKRQAGRIDRELRKGKSGVPDEPDTPMGRFRRGLEAAHIDRSKTVIEDSYTAPDGVVIYRRRIGKMEICRRSGSVSPLGMRSMVMGNEAGDVPCPRGVPWKQD
jgi:hypothetical protein